MTQDLLVAFCIGLLLVVVYFGMLLTSEWFMREDEDD